MQSQLYHIIRTVMMCIFVGNMVYGQSVPKSPSDTVKARQGFVTRMQAFAKDADSSSVADLQSDRVEQVQEATIVEIKKNIQRSKLFLRTGLDTVAAKEELALIVKHVKLMGDRIFVHKQELPSYRNLVTTEKILKVLLHRCDIQKGKLDIYKQKLFNLKYEMDSLASVKDLFKFPEDSVKLYKYIQSLRVMAQEASPIQHQIDDHISQIQTLQNQVNLLVYSLENRLDEIGVYQKQMAGDLLRKELPLLWEPKPKTNTFLATLAYSYPKDKLNLKFYSLSNFGLIVISLVLLAICYAFILSLRRTYHKETENGHLDEDQLILRYPFISGLFLLANLAQFLFNAPPFVFSLMFWVVAAASLTFMMKGYISKFWMSFWLSMLMLFLLSSLDNLILESSNTERWLMLFLALAGIFIGCRAFKQQRRNELREKLIVYAIGLMIILEISSILFNIFGGYNLAKAFLVAGYVNVIIAIMFLWTIRIINQGLQLAFNLYAKQDKSLFFMNFDRVGQKAPALLYVLLTIGWLILFGRNFPAYAFLVEPVRDFFFDQRSIGSYDFSIINLLLFFFVVSMSVIISKVVSFFALDKRTFAKQQEGKRGLGSWILLIRITIIILGLFLAFAAVGIPIDKIAIVLGALGVGIGFGLQSLVNNLVSGLVIAFEKPVNIDDDVEIAGKTGTVKSIGFRSSVIATYDGAEIVMPNGDLLNSHLVNWSSGSGRRRSAMVINISHGSNLQLIKEGIIEILQADDRILKHPEPSIYFQDINAEALELHVFYWSRQPKLLMDIKSDVIVAVNQLFMKNKIQVPYPKQEVFIHDIHKEKKTGY